MIFLYVLLAVVVYMAIGLVTASALVHKHVIKHEVDIMFSVLLWPLAWVAILWAYYSIIVIYAVDNLADLLFKKEEK